MQLSQKTIHAIHPQVQLELPAAHLFELPEKVLQFGTGVLLRALPDYFIDKANKQGLFNGRIVVVKSTGGDHTAFNRQNGLYTVCVRGIDNGKEEQENSINASISRVLSAQDDWDQVLACARQPEIGVVISNTTEVGIQLVQESVVGKVPDSFPGKLLAFLLERFQAFKGSVASGLVIIPTELITDNGIKLKQILMELARFNQLGPAFIEWLDTRQQFCNSLVDRIVPGKPAAAELQALEEQLGYADELLTKSEVFRLWAIEGDDKVRDRLSFAKADAGLVIVPDISRYKELKLRLLNGTHTFSCGTAFLSGFSITRDAVNDPVFGNFTRKLMQEEIAPAIPLDIPVSDKNDYAGQVLERFQNPSIDHQWLSITVQYTSKMKMRNLPLLLRHYQLFQSVPVHMAAGFAAFLLFMKVTRVEGDRYFGHLAGNEYEIRDASAAYFYDVWKNYSGAQLVSRILSNTGLWDTDLSVLPGLAAAVGGLLERFEKNGVYTTLKEL